jgi:hypothetical protein
MIGHDQQDRDPAQALDIAAESAILTAVGCPGSTGLFQRGLLRVS